MTKQFIPGGRRALPTPLTTAEKAAIAADAAGGLVDVQSGGRLAPVCKTISDWDEALQNGYYMGTPDTPNAPTGDWYMGHVIAHNTIWLTQEIFAFTTAQTTNFRQYRRIRNNGNWSDWVKVDVEPITHARAFCGGAGAALAAGETFGFAGITDSTNDFALGVAAGTKGNVLTVPRTGKYLISGRFYQQPNIGAVRYYVRRNFTDSIFTQGGPTGAAAQQINLPATLLSLTAGDHLSLRVDTASNLFLSSGHTELNIDFKG